MIGRSELGFLAFQSGEIAAAEKEYQLAISLNPHYAEAKNNLGSIYGQQGNYQEAERLLRHAIEDNPDYV